MDTVDIQCSNCGHTTHVPFFRELQAKAIEDADMLDEYHKEIREAQVAWFNQASIWDLVKLKLRRDR